ncbi:MAG: hypothetical protein M1114_01300 [Candidatus Dependentiae bacterium]|nr:hypothetical protein [Candidatus Dependentiae bacterium]
MAHIKYGHCVYNKLLSNNPSRSKLDVLLEKQADIHTASLSLELARQYRQVAKDWLVNDLKLFGVNHSLDPIFMDEQPGRAHITHLTRYCLATELLKYKEQEEKWLRSPEGDAKYGTMAYEKMWDRWCEQNK